MNFTKETAYSYFPTYRVEIPTGGEATLAVTSADHVSFDANHHCINGRPGDRCWLVYRGVEYGSHMHFNLKDGEWVNGDHPHASRVSGKMNDASPAAIKWIQGVMLPIVKEFHATHPEVFEQAEQERQHRELESKRTELDNARKQLTEIEADIRRLEQELSK